MTQTTTRIAPGPEALPVALSNGQKAAVIVRLLMAEGAMPRLSGLSAAQQAALVRRMAGLSHVNRATVAGVVQEFARSLDDLGLTFPRGTAGALALLEEHISEPARLTLRAEAEAEGPTDPWLRLAALDPDRLRPLIASESAEICAILLAKLPVARAADLLADLPEDRAQVVAHAVALTGTIAPDTVARIGAALLRQADGGTPPAFATPAAERIGAILNAATGATRDAVLAGLDLRDAAFAQVVRKAIFTFEHIPRRLEPRDVPRVMRTVSAENTATALAAGMVAAPLSVEFLLENMSKRLAEQLREEAEACGTVPTAEGEAAMAAVIASIREQADAGEIRLIPPPD